MSWKNKYEDTHKELSGKRIKTDIRDFEQRADFILNWFERNGIDNKKTILDCGCEEGIFEDILKDNEFNKIIATDIDKKNLKNIKDGNLLCVMNCEDSCFQEERFDVVLALNVLEHLRNPEKTLQNIWGILKPSGLLITSVPNSNFFRRMIGKDIVIPEHLNYWDKKSFKKIMEKNKFEVLETKPIGRIPFVFACNTFIQLNRKQ